MEDAVLRCRVLSRLKLPRENPVNRETIRNRALLTIATRTVALVGDERWIGQLETAVREKVGREILCAILDVGLNEQLAAGREQSRDGLHRRGPTQAPFRVPFLPPRIWEMNEHASDALFRD